MSDGITQRGWIENTPLGASNGERRMIDYNAYPQDTYGKTPEPTYKVPDLNPKQEVDPKAATRFDSGKTDWSQVPFSALEGMVKVLEFGAKKYAKANWTTGGGFDHTRVTNSCFRHLFAYMEGQDTDPESGLSHIWHAQCNLLFLAHYKNNADSFPKDDRIKFISEQ